MMAKKLAAWTLALCLLCLTGCQAPAGDSVEGKIQGVVETVFTVQEGEQMDLLKELYSPSALTSSEPQDAYCAYLRERLPQEDFTADCYEGLPEQLLQVLVFPAFCAESGATVTPKKVTVTLKAEESRVYTYTAELEVTKDGTAASAVAEGSVQLDEEGKIAFFEAVETEELVNAVK